MKNYSKSFLTALALVALTSLCNAEDSVVGKWKGDIDTQIGVQKYTYEFKLEGTNMTGKAYSVNDMGTNEVALTAIKIDKDEIKFAEQMKYQDNSFDIAYTGKIKGDEINFHRKVGEVAEEDFVAKRVKPEAARPEAKP